MSDYKELVEQLKDYSCCRKGEIAQLTAAAAAAIEALEARLGEAENSVELWKDMYLTKHEPKRGEWIGRQNHKKCSVCGKQAIYDVALYTDMKTPYCPHCGAKMMEVQDD